MSKSVAVGSARPIRVLLVEDQPHDAQKLRRMLTDIPPPSDSGEKIFAVTAVDGVTAALDCLNCEAFDIVLLALRLPETAGNEALLRIRRQAPETPIVVLTDCDDQSLALWAIRQGAQDYLPKDELDQRLLVRTIRHAIHRKRTERQLLKQVRQVEQAQCEIHRQAKELDQRNRQLNRISTELDDFAYIASHDLKEPLRSIRAHCEILLEDYGQMLGQQGCQRIAKLVELCNRLEQLISNLLTYFRLGCVAAATTTVDLGEIVDGVLESFRPALERRGVVHVEGRLPAVQGDPTLISMVLSNLISNGLKFNQSQQPRVEIGCLPTQPPTIFVRDNGIGIPPEQVGLLFSMFGRLHPHCRYDGNGVGLAIVRRIIEAHGGQIWVRSRPGEGTTFYFTLAPLQAAEKTSGDARTEHAVGTTQPKHPTGVGKPHIAPQVARSNKRPR